MDAPTSSGAGEPLLGASDPLPCCSNPACLAVLASLKRATACPGCDVVAYCDAACLEADRAAHLIVCRRIAEEWFAQELALALRGRVDSQFNAARCLTCGRGADADPVEAARLLTSAAAGGHAAAALALGQAYRSGTGVAVDLEVAWRWCLRGAELRDVAAQAYVGACLLTGGCGAAADPVAAARWLTEAALSGHAESQFSLGGCYEFGAGVARDAAQARHWYESAVATNGGRHAAAEAALARLTQHCQC